MGDLTTPGQDMTDTANPAGLNGAGESQTPRAAPQPQVSSGHSEQPSKDSSTSRDPWRPRRPAETPETR